ncbi:hypothetical protein SAMN05660964_00128 [Thiothrix caldifontis]|uniref:Uncharacterized protein n=1 Tax=Thiothrix caldifontis TaxID=525918 RepID=A0A1H3VLA7_9GAMM|nr:hypothetical protein [Thiothrix caldifontis]SDZ75044.1 hypothetical protein SAMN05660964_00128 [Thiothrix caldifontis]
MKVTLLSILCVGGLTACQPPPQPIPQKTQGFHVPSVEEISASKERYFAEQLPLLKARNPEAEAKAAISQGNRYFLCNAGRSSTVPGIAPEVFAQVRDNCPTECLDGVTDALYGENHRRYLAVALDYSAKWNRVMLAACR